MRRTFPFLILAIALSTGPASAQSAHAIAPALPRAATPVEVQSAPPARATTPAPVDPRIDMSDVNIAVTVTITDKATSGNQTKTVSLLFGNQSSGRVRSNGNTSVTPTALAGSTIQSNRSSELNVDAGGTLMKSGQIKTNMTVIYQPEWTDDVSKMTGVTHSVFSLYLKDGQPTVITQAADPTMGSRSVTIEVTAKVIK